MAITYEQFIKQRISELSIIIECTTDSYRRDAAIMMLEEYRDMMAETETEV